MPAPPSPPSIIARQKALPLRVLAHWWARDPLEMRTEHEVYSELLLACVGGRLEAVTAKNELVDFRVLLMMIASNKHHPGFNIADGTPFPPRHSVGNPYQPLLLYRH